MKALLRRFIIWIIGFEVEEKFRDHWTLVCNNDRIGSYYGRFPPPKVVLPVVEVEEYPPDHVPEEVELIVYRCRNILSDSKICFYEVVKQ